MPSARTDSETHKYADRNQSPPLTKSLTGPYPRRKLFHCACLPVSTLLLAEQVVAGLAETNSTCGAYIITVRSKMKVVLVRQTALMTTKLLWRVLGKESKICPNSEAEGEKTAPSSYCINTKKLTAIISYHRLDRGLPTFTE